ncbi:hypothetical protein [Agrobacterium vitis]|uniref:Uncharacterized protein n=1 Tax=Agrobacterium vitis TaxID=373 RepID=A0AAE2UWK3_AGRVI|nr:hypothetical protein [Agrobacterium vitis]MBF2715069.1 hypothetical protein [Agrobacterium vitis]
MKQIFFFATPADIKPVIYALEMDKDLGFVRVGIHDRPDPPIVSSSEISQPGIATNETASGSISYLIVPRGAHLQTREYINEESSRPGTKEWSVYNGFNEESVEVTLAGLWKEGTLLPGSVKTMHTTKWAQAIMRNFQSELKKEDFKKVQSWWLGREALQMLRTGKRLSVTAVQSPPEYDLTLENLPVELR